MEKSVKVISLTAKMVHMDNLVELASATDDLAELASIWASAQIL